MIVAMTTYMQSIAPLADFTAAINEGLVRLREHDDPNVPYVTFDYTEMATFAKAWNDVTVSSRGLIVNRETGEIIARPFRKFYNDTEDVPGYNDFPRRGPVVVTDKADGSMGILYQRPDGKWAIATRGSMGSDQALHATDLYNTRYAHTWTPRQDVTYLFEIIYPGNRIVLDYGDMDDLILIGAVDKATGVSLPLDEARQGWTGPVVEVLPFASYTEALQADIPADREGFVVHFLDTDHRVKLKGADYLRLHKVMTGVTRLRVWENLMTGADMDTWLVMVPEEFADQVRACAADLQAQHDTITSRLNDTAAAIVAQWDGQDRKALAALVAANADKSVMGLMFAVIDGKTDKVSESVWKQIRPHGKEAL